MISHTPMTAPIGTDSAKPAPPSSSTSLGATGEKKKPFSMVRTFALADLITLGNAFCGTGAVLASMSYVASNDHTSIWAALVLLPLALICDALDGAVARWRRRSSPLGADLDSLADIVSFGVAPAALGFALGLRGGWDAACLCFFVACGISRLARYNVTAAALSDETGKVRYYEGTPIPTSLALVAVLGAAFGTHHVGGDIWLGGVTAGPWMFHPLVLMYVVSGALMVSTIRIPKP
ncbi:MAG: CDP-diacylglycerol--serine O-phosphatidyltransferase [Labilithrix sp.]|nr:CDP-diacylglycerol--serine O-phosphatidyltransferase [Labilithrix sp.]